MRIAISQCHVKHGGAVNAKFRMNERDELAKVNRFLIGILMHHGHLVQYIEDPSLADRINLINAGHDGMPYDLTIENHLNAFDTTKSGCMVLHAPGGTSRWVDQRAVHTAEPSSPRRLQAEAMSCILASYVGNENLGPRPGWYWGGRTPGMRKDAFLTKTMCPAFILEAGYIDNDKFCDTWFACGRHKQLAEAHYQALDTFKL